MHAGTETARGRLLVREDTDVPSMTMTLNSEDPPGLYRISCTTSAPVTMRQLREALQSGTKDQRCHPVDSSDGTNPGVVSETGRIMSPARVRTQ